MHKVFCIISSCSAEASICPKIILIIENIEKGHCYIPSSPLGLSSMYLTLSRLPQIQASFESSSDFVTSVAHAWSEEGPYGAHGEIPTILSLILCECRTSCPLLLLLFSPVLSVSRGCHIPTNLPNTPLTMCCENRLVRTFAISHSPSQAIQRADVNGYFRQMILMDFNTEPRPTLCPRPHVICTRSNQMAINSFWSFWEKASHVHYKKMRKQGKQMWATLAHILACIQARFHIYFG